MLIVRSLQNHLHTWELIAGGQGERWERERGGGRGRGVQGWVDKKKQELVGYRLLLLLPVTVILPLLSCPAVLLVYCAALLSAAARNVLPCCMVVVMEQQCCLLYMLLLLWCI